MDDPDYMENLKAFIGEIGEMNNFSFVEYEKWRLPMPEEMFPLNSVLIGYDLDSKQDREILHNIGQQYGLIPLCPNDVVDLDLSDLLASGLPKAYVHSIHGKFYLGKPKLNGWANMVKEITANEYG